MLTLDKNVELPETIAVTAVSPSGQEQVVVAKRPVRRSQIPFPAVTTDTLIVTLTYRQPLRILEVAVIEERPQTTTRQGVRFLAQPNQSYQLFTNPDRPVANVVGESGNLNRVQEVLVLPPVTLSSNPHYIPADEDGDGVPDTTDNCLLFANPDQTDIDNNGIGDECDDWDKDGVVNYLDNCDTLPNQRQVDTDGDGVGDVCDDEESRLTEQYFWLVWLGLGTGFVTIVGLFWFVLQRTPRPTGPDGNEDTTIQ